MDTNCPYCNNELNVPQAALRNADAYSKSCVSITLCCGYAINVTPIRKFAFSVYKGKATEDDWGNEIKVYEPVKLSDVNLKDYLVKREFNKYSNAGYDEYEWKYQFNVLGNDKMVTEPIVVYVIQSAHVNKKDGHYTTGILRGAGAEKRYGCSGPETNTKMVLEAIGLDLAKLIKLGYGAVKERHQLETMKS